MTCGKGSIENPSLSARLPLFHQNWISGLRAYVLGHVWAVLFIFIFVSLTV